MGRTYSLVEHRLTGVIAGISRIDICHNGNRLIGTVHVAPPHQILVGLLNQVQCDIFERRTDVLYLAILLFGQSLASQLLLAASQQELSLFAQVVGSCGTLLRHEVEALQHVHRSVDELDGFCPIGHVRLYIALHVRLGGTSASALSTHGLLGIEDGVVFQFCP